MLNRPTLKNESTFIDFLEFIKIVHNVYINQIKCGGWMDVHVFLLKSTSLGPAQLYHSYECQRILGKIRYNIWYMSSVISSLTMSTKYEI